MGMVTSCIATASHYIGILLVYVQLIYLTLMCDPVGLIRTFIQRAGKAIPSTSKDMNNYNQLEEEFAHAHFENAENKHKVTYVVFYFSFICLVFPCCCNK